MTFFRQALSSLVPKYLLNRMKPAEWELKLTAEWAKCTGLAGLAPFQAYLDYCRQWPYYGATYFPATKTVKNASFLIDQSTDAA
jgi:hypothetical protein